jgi:hypothetical protein
MKHALILCLMLSPLSGCAGLGLKALTQDGVTPQRQKRNEETTRLFDQQRDIAEYEAARSRW